MLARTPPSPRVVTLAPSAGDVLGGSVPGSPAALMPPPPAIATRSTAFPGQRSGDSGLSQLFNVARTGSSGTQVTTGVRGLEAEQIANASANAAELKKMQACAASPVAAAKVALQGKLQAVGVEEPQ